MNISKIFLYDEPSIPEIRIKSLSSFLQNYLQLNVEIRKNILNYSLKSTAFDIASCRIFNIRKPFERHNPSSEEIKFEKENFQNFYKTQNIVMYDGFELARVFGGLIPKDDQAFENLHVIFTNKLTCTYDVNDYRYHGRALIGGNPSIISTTGIVEAPAKPRNYYLDLMTNIRQGLNVESIKKRYSGQYLGYHDTRLSNVSEGYLLQTIFYYWTGEAFCQDKKCRLYNAHWQKELIESQIENRKLCQKHQKYLSHFVNDLNLSKKYL